MKKILKVIFTCDFILHFLMLGDFSFFHGARGDGVAGLAFDLPPTDFATDQAQRQSDGALFWKLLEGKPPWMISFKQMLSEDKR